MGKDRKTKKGNREDELDDESSTISDQPTKSKNKKGKRGNDEDTWDDVLEQTKQTHVDKDSKDVGRKKKDKKKGKSQSISDDEESIPTKLGSSDEESVKPKKNQKKKEKKKFDDDDDEVDVILANQMKKVDVLKPKVKKPQVKSVFEFLNDEGMDLDDDDSGDDKQSEKDIEIEFEKSLAEVGRKKEDKGKKGKKEKKRKEADEEFERMVAEIEMADSKKGKSKQKEVKEDFEDKMATVVTEISEEDDDKKGKKKKKKKREDDEEILDEIEDKMATVVTEIPEEDDDKKGKKKKKKRREEDDEGEDIEEKMAVVVTEIPDDEDDKKSKKKKKKMKDDEGVDDENKDLNEGEDGDEGGTIKTAAQKKKEKKERERLKKIALKAQDKGKKKVDVQDKPLEGKGDGSNEMKDDEDYARKGDDELEDGGKKKKDKGKKKKDEKEEKDKKRPGKKQILAMQEALKKLKEEEDKARLEEEARQKAAEEAENLRLEKLRLEQERKERKKQKEKEKRERLKAEGKLLTQAQKQQRARAQAMLEALRAQGLDVPKIGEKKERTPRPGDRIRPKKVKPISATEEESKVDVSIEPKLEISSESIALSLEGKTPRDDDQSLLQSPEEEIKESWDQVSNDDVKDSWDISSSEDESGKPERKDGTHKKTMANKKPVSDESSGESESESDESEFESEDESSSEESESENEEEAHKPTSEKLRERAVKRIEKRKEENEKNRSTAKLRSPVVCVLGHVDTGKTKILDKIRHTHVQDSEAGGITQQIGATMVPMEAIREQSKMAKNFMNFETIIPGLLIIDTPGHESFSNLRSRGSSLCDIAILVVDIMHGLEPQTLESIKLLRAKKTPFVVALNKIDRLYEWKPNKHKDVQDTLKSQNRNTQLEFEERVKSTVTQFAEQSLNVKLFYENNDPRIFISLVPTSAHTGDGMGNLMALIVELTQNMMSKQISYSDELQATVLEVKAVPGLGTTIDVILVNGRVREGDTIILAGTDGPLVTQIRSLLMPQPLKELRVKNPYQEFKEVEAAQGIKVTGKDLDRAIAGLNLLVAHHPDEVEICKEEVAKELQAAMNSIKLSERGVYVQASTLGSLEALIEFLRSSSIPYSGVRIGPVVKKDVMKASVMLEHDSQYAVILAFDVKIERDAQELADSLGVKIFSADIIYHLFDKFTSYRDELKRKKRDQFKHIAVFPCKLRILPQFVYNTRDPIVIGVSVEAGVVKEGTPLCVPSRDFLDIGIVTTIQLNHKSMDSARKGQEVCIKIEPNSGETPKLYGRHFEHTDPLVSKITRQSIDACKEHFRDDLQKTDWQLMVELKKAFQIV